MKQIFILTYCRSLDLLWSSTLVFDSLRVGFPHSQIFVFDNVSLPEARSVIREKCLKLECQYVQLQTEVLHHDFIEEKIRTHSGCVIFVDPDICFWKSCEDWAFDALFAGRYVPQFYDDFAKAITVERLHTSLFWIPDAQKLTKCVEEVQLEYFDFHPLRPFAFKHDADWYRYDAGSTLYSAFRKYAYQFTDRELSCYDHLFCGSHLDFVLERIDEASARTLRQFYSAAKSSTMQIKGVWKQQDAYFEERRPRRSVLLGRQ